MNDLTFDSKGWGDYLHWQTQDRKTLKKSIAYWKIYSETEQCIASENLNC